MSVTAETLLFSGVANPRASLDASEETDLRARYSRAKQEIQLAEPPPSSVGYNGVLVTLEGDPNGDGPAHSLLAARGVVEEFLPDGNVIAYRDVTGIESFVRACVERHVPGLRELLAK